MDMEMLFRFLEVYGGIAVFVVVFLEYLNLPGFPAGIIMPLAGIWAAGGGISFVSAVLLSVAAGVAGSWLLYLLGRWGGLLFLQRYLRRFPSHAQAIERNFALLRKRGFFGVFFSKLIPMLRTLISIPAGVLQMNFWSYTVSSALGILVWNLLFVGAGYFLGERFLRLML